MEKRVLGRSGIDLPVLGFGCGPNAQLMVSDDVSAQVEVVRHSIEAGVDYFDTAAGYGDGRSETNLGRALTELGARPTISTKVVLEADDYANVKDAALRCFEGSLERLQLDKVDALMLHNRVAHSRDVPTAGSGVTLSLDDIFGSNGIAEAFAELRSAGVIKATGFTAFGGEPEAVQQMVESGIFDAINASYNVVNPSAGLRMPVGYPDADYNCVIDQAREAGLGVMAIRVLSSGSLLRPFEEDSREAKLVAIAGGLGESIVSVAIRYVLSKPGMTSAIMGFSESSHIDDAAAAAAKGPLDAATIARLESVALAL